MRALDLFCGAGGVSVGLQRAGLEVTGVDIAPQPHHRGGTFVQADALNYPLEGFDLIWASPPCQAHSRLRHLSKGKDYPNLIPATRARLIASGTPYIIENVEGAPLGGNLTLLCGSMFGLQTPDGRAEIRRHRVFETSFPVALRPACQHGQSARLLTVVGHTPVDNTYRSRRRRAMSVTGNPAQTNTIRNTVRETFSTDDARAAMGIDWMPMKYLSQAIPPAYAEFLGREAMAFLAERKAIA